MVKARLSPVDWSAPSGERVLFSGDLLNGQVAPELAREDHYRRAPGLAFGSRPQYVERHPDPAALKRSLDRLLQERIDVVCGSHALPFGDDPHAAIRRLRDTL
jgi:glyoxylase-like metal-dependent hydrolase (beta-lactamase superfamily II)